VPLDLSKRWFAWAMWRLAPRYDALLADRKRELLSQVSGTVVEIGPGTGTNFQYFPRGIRWIGLEPNRHMHPYLRLAAKSAGVTVEIRQSRAEDLQLNDECVDTVVATAVLCTVQNPIRVLQEIRRVLKPSGRFVFIEHVAGERGTQLRTLQRMIQPVWRCLADGCHPARDTAELITQSGFRPVFLDSFRIPLGPVAPHIAGIAVR